jgi:hypothetical protein
VVHDKKEMHDMKRVKMVRTLVLSLVLAGAVGVTVSGCLLPVPVPVGGGFHHHHRDRW